MPVNDSLRVFITSTLRPICFIFTLRPTVSQPYLFTSFSDLFHSLMTLCRNIFLISHVGPKPWFIEFKSVQKLNLLLKAVNNYITVLSFLTRF